jgi:prevent-host-death family protein
MVKSITATQASRRFAEVLDAVEHRGDEFLVKRHGRNIARISPAARVRARWSDVAAVLRNLPAPDASFARDIAQARRGANSRVIRRHAPRRVA